MGKRNDETDTPRDEGWGTGRVIPYHVLEAKLDTFGREVVERVRRSNRELLQSYQSIKPLMSVDDVAKTLGVSPRTVEKIIQSGKIDPLWVGGQRRFHPDAIDAYLRHSCDRRRPAGSSR